MEKGKGGGVKNVKNLLPFFDEIVDLKQPKSSTS